MKTKKNRPFRPKRGIEVPSFERTSSEKTVTEIVSIGLILTPFLSGILAFGFLFSGCGGRDSGEGAAKSYQYVIPWKAEGEDSYTVQPVEVKTLHDPLKLRGEAAVMHYSPQSNDDGFKDRDTKFRFVKTGDGVYMAGDTGSLQAATVYAHQERIYELEKEIGIDKIVKYPRQIGINVNLVAEEGGPSLKNNAFYEPRNDIFIIVPYESSDEMIPIPINGGIIAHEHSHAIFQRIVRDKIKVAVTELLPGGSDIRSSDDSEEEGADNFEGSSGGAGEGAGQDGEKPTTDEHGSEQRDEEGDGLLDIKESDVEPLSIPEVNAYVLRGLDEGLSDVFAWIYLGVSDYIGESLLAHKEKRKIDGKQFVLPAADEIRLLRKVGEEDIPKEKIIIREAYRLGTNYARFIYHIAKAENLMDRKGRIEMAKMIYHKALPKFASYYSGESSANNGVSSAIIPPDLFIESFADENPEIFSKHCEAFQAILSRSSLKKGELCE